jgi:hypothetical protein
MVHVTVAITDFIMMLIWAGVWSMAWITGGVAISALILGGGFMGLRSAWRRHSVGKRGPE